MTDKLRVINRALVKIGAETITDPDEQSEPARVAGIVFDTLARSEMRGQAWSFAKGRAQLAALAQAPAFGWQYAYQLPDDYLRVIQINDYYDFASLRGVTSERIVPYEIEGKTLLTNYAAPLRLRYVRDLSGDVGTWDASFFEAFACRLAAEICGTLTKASGREVKLFDQYRLAIREAKRTNAIELPPDPLPDNSWMSERI